MTIQDEILYDRLWQLASVDAPVVDLSDLDQEATHRVLAIARVHGVLGLVLHKLRASPPAHREIWEIAQRAWKGEVVQSMRVRRHAQKVLNTLRNAGLPAVIIKGPDFADHLFAEPRLRPTLDVDVLLPHEHWLEAVRLLESTGHKEKPQQPPMFLATGVVSERSWIHPLADSTIEVDLHWNLVHLPFFRRQASLAYWELDWRWEPDGTGTLTAASRLVIAAVHAVYHHQFDRLALLTDLQLACRQIQNNADQQALRGLLARTHTQMAVDVALQITARFLEDSKIDRLWQVVQSGSNRLRPLPQGLFDDARRNLRSIRTHFMAPGRQRIRDWLLQQPPRPEPGWEMRPAGISTTQARLAAAQSSPVVFGPQFVQFKKH